MFWTLFNRTSNNYTFKQIFTPDQYTKIYSENTNDPNTIYSLVQNVCPKHGYPTETTYEKIFVFSIKMYRDLILYEFHDDLSDNTRITSRHCFQYKCEFIENITNSNIEFDYTYTCVECNQMPNLPNHEYDVMTKLKIYMSRSTENMWNVLEIDINSHEEKMYLLI